MTAGPRAKMQKQQGWQRKRMKDGRKTKGKLMECKMPFL